MIEQTIYNRVAEARSERGISRDKLAKSLGITSQALGHLELGHYYPDLTLALHLAEVLDVDVRALFSLKPFKTSNKEIYA